MNKKTLREERTAAEWKNVAQQPAADGESRKRDSFLFHRNRDFPEGKNGGSYEDYIEGWFRKGICGKQKCV